MGKYHRKKNGLKQLDYNITFSLKKKKKEGIEYLNSILNLTH